MGSLRGGKWLGTSSPRWWGEGLGRQLGPKCGGQVLLHLLPARLLQVIARRVLQMGLYLWNVGETGWEGTRQNRAQRGDPEPQLAPQKSSVPRLKMANQAQNLRTLSHTQILIKVSPRTQTPFLRDPSQPSRSTHGWQNPSQFLEHPVTVPKRPPAKLVTPPNRHGNYTWLPKTLQWPKNS